jgi:phosphatidylserine decarboxylase
MVAPTGHYEPIAREGYLFVIPAAVPAVAAWWLGYDWAALAFLVITVAIALFFRNPERVPPPGTGLIVSPADGTVVAVVEEARSSALGDRPVQRVSIFMSIFNVHVNRCPLAGEVRAVSYAPGKFLDAREPDSSELNEHNSLTLEGNEGTIEVVQIAGKVARRIACWVAVGDQVFRGQRFGLIRFGSRLDVFLPGEFGITVRPGQRVRAGVSVIAHVPQPERG